MKIIKTKMVETPDYWTQCDQCGFEEQDRLRDRSGVTIGTLNTIELTIPGGYYRQFFLCKECTKKFIDGLQFYKPVDDIEKEQ